MHFSALEILRKFDIIQSNTWLVSYLGVNKHIPKWHQRCNLDCMHSERLNKKWLHSIFTINSYRKCILLNLRKLQSCLFIHSYKLCKKFKRGRCGRSRPLKIWHHYFTKSWKNWYQLTSTDKSKHHRMWKELIKLTLLLNTTTTTSQGLYSNRGTFHIILK